MNWQDYIESGLLELYVMGSLSNEEMEEIRALELKHPALANEIDKIQGALMKHSEENVSLPSQTFLAKVKSNIESSTKPESEKHQTGRNNPDHKIRSLYSQLKTIRVIAASVVLLFVVSAIFNYLQYQEGQEKEMQLAKLEGELESRQLFEAQLEKANFEKQQNFNHLLAHINDSSTIVIRLKGQAINPNAYASVYWNKRNDEVYINPSNLPETDERHQYQLWALVDGKPIDAGIFETGTEIQSVKMVTQAQAFAVTLEPKGGSLKPTLEKLFVVGTVPSA